MKRCMYFINRNIVLLSSLSDAYDISFGSTYKKKTLKNRKIIRLLDDKRKIEIWIY